MTPTRLDNLRQTVDCGAALIEQAFVAAGQGLGEGLAGFDGLVREMTDFLAGLQGGDLTEASQVLAALASRLVATGRALPRDAASLQDLVVGNAGIAKHLDTLLDDVRMMFIIARSARIEAVVFGKGTGLDAFTREIASLTQTVKDEVDRCAQAHAVLTGRIGRIAASQADLDRDYREKLVVLSQDLTEMFAAIEARQGETSGAMRKLGERGAKIAAATGTALMALQSGDATRQRLEHVSRAIEIARDVVAGTRPVDDEERGAVLAAILRLQASQIRALSNDFDRDVAHVDGLLVRLGKNAVELVEGGGALMRGGGSAKPNCLATFRARLTEAAGLVGTCERARQDVEAAMVLFRNEITALSASVAALDAVTVNLIMIGINSGLKAARLGTSGRSLTVIADELKRLAGIITGEAARLVVAFRELETTSHRLDHDDREAELSSSDDDLLAIAAKLETLEGDMARFFATMGDRALGFGADLGRARVRFGLAVSSSADRAAAAQQLDELSETVEAGTGLDRAAAHLTNWLCPLYTMQCERDLHAALLGSAPKSVLIAAVAQASEGIDAFLFDVAV